LFLPSYFQVIILALIDVFAFAGACIIEETTRKEGR
jgi:hypothetical protein